VTEFFQRIKAFVSSTVEASRPEASPIPQPDPAHLLEDLRLFLHQLAASITEHMEYERQIAHGLPRDSTLVLRFEISDYVSDLFDFFERKRLLSADEDVMFRAAIHVLVPPESVRDKLPPQYWRRLFAGVLSIIAERTGRSTAVLTKQFYAHISRDSSINGIPGKQVLESFQEALDLVSREASEYPTKMDQTPSFEPKKLLRDAFAACGAGSYKSLYTIVMRHHTLELAWFIVAATVLATAAVLVLPAIVPPQIPSDLMPSTPVVPATLAAYLIAVGLRTQQYRIRTTRRRTLVRVSNAISHSVGLTYKEIDEVLHEFYGTSLADLRNALLPRRLRRDAGKQ
jgi:hypothetical protein